MGKYKAATNRTSVLFLIILIILSSAPPLSIHNVFALTEQAYEDGIRRGNEVLITANAAVQFVLSDFGVSGSWAVKQVEVSAGYRWGTDSSKAASRLFWIRIWDKDLHTLFEKQYRYDTFQGSSTGEDTNWRTIDLGTSVVVQEKFYVAVFAADWDQSTGAALFIQFSTYGAISGHSCEVQTAYGNAISKWRNDLNWFIRTLGESESTPDPSPQIISKEVSTSTITLGQTFDLTVTAKNNGGITGDWSTLSVSFPAFTSPDDAAYVSVINDDFDGINNPYFVKAGGTIQKKDGTTRSACYLLVEGNDIWSNNEQHSFTLRIKPKGSGTFTVFVRGTFTDKTDTSKKFYDPSSSSITDQQDYNVYTVSVTVNPPSSFTLIPPWISQSSYESVIIPSVTTTASSLATTTGISGYLYAYSVAWIGGAGAIASIKHSGQYTAPISGEYRIEYEYSVEGIASIYGWAPPVSLVADILKGALREALLRVLVPKMADLLGVKNAGVHGRLLFVFGDEERVKDVYSRETWTGMIPTWEDATITELITDSFTIELVEGQTYDFYALLTGWTANGAAAVQASGSLIRMDGYLIRISIQPPGTEQPSLPIEQRTITFLLNPSQAGTISFLGTTYNDGEDRGNLEKGEYPSVMAIVDAELSSNLRFFAWTSEGGVTVQNKFTNPTTVSVDESGQLRADFEAKISFLTEPANIGEIQYGTSEFTHGEFIWEKNLLPAYRDMISLKAIVPAGYEFVEWRASNDKITISSPKSIDAQATVAGSGTITAVFKETEQSVSGRVTDSLTGKPVNSAVVYYRVSGVGDYNYVYSDGDGYYSFKASAGNYEVYALADNYLQSTVISISVGAGEKLIQNFVLAQPSELFIALAEPIDKENVTIPIRLSTLSSGVLLKIQVYSNGTVVEGATVKFYTIIKEGGSSLYMGTNTSDTNGFASIIFELSYATETSYFWYVTVEKYGYDLSTSQVWTFTYYPLSVTLESPFDGAIIGSSPIELKAKVTQCGRVMEGIIISFFVNNLKIGGNSTNSSGYASVLYSTSKEGDKSWHVWVEVGVYDYVVSPTWVFTYCPLSVTLESPFDGAIIGSLPIELKAKVTSGGISVQAAKITFYVEGKYVGYNLSNSSGYAIFNYLPIIEKPFHWYVIVEKVGYDSDTSETWIFAYNSEANPSYGALLVDINYGGFTVDPLQWVTVQIYNSTGSMISEKFTDRNGEAFFSNILITQTSRFYTVVGHFQGYDKVNVTVEVRESRIYEVTLPLSTYWILPKLNIISVSPENNTISSSPIELMVQIAWPKLNMFFFGASVEFYINGSLFRIVQSDNFGYASITCELETGSYNWYAVSEYPYWKFAQSETKSFIIISTNELPTNPILTSPNDNDIWSGIQNITWSTSTTPDNDTITYEVQYSINDGENWSVLSSGILETYYQWDTTKYPDDANYLIRIRAYNDIFYSDWSQSNDLMIDNTAPIINITYPVEGAYLTSYIVWINGTITELNIGILISSINDSRFSLVCLGSTFAFRNVTNITSNMICVKVSFSDLAGNMGSSVVTFTYSSISTTVNEELTALLQELSTGWDQDAVIAANLILSDTSYGSEDWKVFFGQYFGSNPYTDDLRNYLGYPVFWWFSEEVHLNLQKGLIGPIMDNIRGVIQNHCGDLSDELAGNQSMLQTLTNSHRFLNDVAKLGVVGDEVKAGIFNFYVDLIDTYPQLLKKSVTFDIQSQPYLATLRAQTWMNLREMVPLNQSLKGEIAAAIGLDGRYLDIWNDFSILVIDNNGFDSIQLDEIYSLLNAVPKSLHELGSITCNDLLGNIGERFLWFYTKMSVNIFNIEVGAAAENGFPDDVDPVYSDLFSLVLVHEVNHAIDANLQSVDEAFQARRADLIDRAGSDKMNYLRSVCGDGFFVSYPQEFFASISNQYFSNTSRTLELGIKRFHDGYHEPLNQFLFFADAFSFGSNKTIFYTLDAEGNIVSENITIGRNSVGHITSLLYNKTLYKFSVDDEGNVLAVDIQDTAFNVSVTFTFYVDEEGYVITNLSINSETELTGGLGAYILSLTAPEDVIVLSATGGELPFNAPPTVGRLDGQIVIVGFISETDGPQLQNLVLVGLRWRLNSTATTELPLETFGLVVVDASSGAEHNVTVSSETLGFMRGDINRDGHVSIADAMFIAQYLAGNRPITGFNLLNAASIKQDENEGEKITIADAMFIAQYLAGLRDECFNLKQ